MVRSFSWLTIVSNSASHLRRCLPRAVRVAILIFYSRSLNPSGTPVIVRTTEREGIKMKRAILFALMLVAVLAPLAGVARADLKSDQTIPQAP